MIAYAVDSPERTLAAFALLDARRLIVADRDRRGIDALFDAIDRDQDQRRFAYTLFELAAGECVPPERVMDGFAALKTEGDVTNPEAQVSIWCVRFITAAANQDDAVCSALFESIDDERGSACLGYMVRLMAAIYRQRKFCEQ